jgi:hypothetical protein
MKYYHPVGMDIIKKTSHNKCVYNESMKKTLLVETCHGLGMICPLKFHVLEVLFII